MAPVTITAPKRGLGETARKDGWWIQPLLVLLGFTAFIVYSTWAAFQNAHYTWGPYLSPFYSPEIYGDSPHAWFGPKPGWWPSFLPFSPALLILPIPGLFRFTCYYYRGAYYKAFWADPPNCAVGELRNHYRGEQKLPLVLQNVHRYALVLALLVLVVLVWDAWKALWFPAPGGGTEFGIGLGTVVLVVNCVLLYCYTLGCHSLRHLAGGVLDVFTGRPVQKKVYDCVSCLNRRHMMWAWLSLFSVGFSDLYVRLVSMGVWRDWRIV
jgi:hypothetical protein